MIQTTDEQERELTARLGPSAVRRASPRRRVTQISSVVLALVLCGRVVLAQSPAPPLTLDAALQLALANNKTIAAARLQRGVSQAAVDVARERPNPDLTYEAARETPRDAVMLTLPLELGGKRNARVSAAQAAVASDEARLDAVIAGVMDEVRHTYIGLLAAQQRVVITQDVADLFARARDAAHARFQAGAVPRRDDIAAQADFLVAQADVAQARGDVRATRATLNALLGQPLGTEVTVVPAPPQSTPALEAAFARLEGANTELRVLDREIAVQQARIAVARSMQTADISAGGGLSFDAQPEFSVGWRVNFGVTVPLFTAHKAGVAVENAALVRLRAERDATRAEIQGAVGAAIERAASAAERVRAYENDILPLSLQDEAFAQASYQSGQTGLNDLVLALQHARERRFAALQASLDLQTALADLERAITGSIR